jgi:mannose-6-phosphate isomerase-like protein (cupin superfamily)
MVIEAGPKAQVFNLKTPLLSVGRSNKVLGESEQLKMRLKVYAEGGENGLHTHKDEDHAFVILQGEATFFDENGAESVVGKYEGIMIPRGAFYHFRSTGNENLVLLRSGAGREAEGEHRVGPNGIPLTREENGRVDGVPVPGEFFGV